MLAACASPPPPGPPPAPASPPADRGLESVSHFAAITDPDARSQALFLEASKVMLHARCVNCHPAGDSPHQGDAMALHEPPVVRGPEGEGVVGMRCDSCHQETNLELARVPGAPHWHLAPRSMAWEGLSPAELCAQLKDPARNGGMSLEAIVKHSTEDPLVGWGFDPGHGRTPAPGNQALFGSLVAAWVADGAVCPPKEGTP